MQINKDTFFYLLLVAFTIGLFFAFGLVACDIKEQVMFCPECGATYRKDSTYCNHDGHELKEIER